ncbi:MAG: hypothetical protein JSW03_10930 [Candidatus Eiseniibacteriota bacterium]|nr:MAG: hypothetical protein JSW03_10930 [Candidatus Eisenbacteria bacterium]
MTGVRKWMGERYKRYVEDYTRYARMRGFKTELNDWPYVRRSFLECWAQPGFHRFWHLWNPGIAYFVYRLYIRLGGRRRWALPTVASFVLCGLIHTLIVAPFFRRWSYSVIGAFACFGVLTVLSRYLDSTLRQDRWPVPVNVLVNVGLVIASFDVGFRIDRLLG